MKLKHHWTTLCSHSVCQWKSVFKNELGASYSRSSALLYFQLPLHCWDRSAVLFAFIFSSLFIKWLLVISISSILSSAVLNSRWSFLFSALSSSSTFSAFSAAFLYLATCPSSLPIFCSKVVISCSAFESLNLYSLICLLASPRQKLTWIQFSE